MIVGDSNMNETTTLLKVGTADLVLRMIEAGVVMRDLTLENPIRAIREIQPRHHRPAQGAAGQRPGGLARWRSSRSTWPRRRTSSSAGAVTRPRSGCSTCGGGCCARSRPATWTRSPARSTGSSSCKLIERYRAKHDLPLSHPRVAQIDLAYHDIRRGRGLYYLLERRGEVDRVATDLGDLRGEGVPPQTTRARLRGEFIRQAQEKRRDFTVDWVHLKLNDQAQRTVLCKDPFRAYDERVERLIASM